MAVDFGLQGQVAIVTGSTSGIGHALADALAAQGCNIVMNGLGEMNAIERARAEMAETHGVEVLYHGADMTKPDQIADMVRAAKAEFGELDILVNNAGVQHVAPIEDFPDDKWDLIMAVNLSSAFHATKAAVPIMKDQGRGRIINIASAHGLVASPFKAAYVAAKHGIIGLTKVTALENAKTQITCNAICPGWVDTPLVRKQIEARAAAQGVSIDDATRQLVGEKQPSERFVSPEHLAELALFLTTEAGGSITGSAYTMDGGWTAQ